MAGPQTMMGDAVGLAIKEFHNSDAQERVLILLTDGNDTGSRMPPVKAAETAKQRGIKIHMIAIGNPKATGEEKVDVKLMQSISATTGGQFFLGQGQRQLADVYATLDRITPKNYKTQSYRPKRQLFMYPLGAAVLLVLGYHLLMFAWAAIRSLAAGAENLREQGEAVRLPNA